MSAQLTQAHHFLIRVGDNPDAVLDLLDEELVDADINFATRVHTWRFPDGSQIQAREGEDIDLDLSLTQGEAR